MRSKELELSSAPSPEEPPTLSRIWLNHSTVPANSKLFENECSCSYTFNRATWIQQAIQQKLWKLYVNQASSASPKDRQPSHPCHAVLSPPPLHDTTLDQPASTILQFPRHTTFVMPSSGFLSHSMGFSRTQPAKEKPHKVSSHSTQMNCRKYQYI